MFGENSTFEGLNNSLRFAKISNRETIVRFTIVRFTIVRVRWKFSIPARGKSVTGSLKISLARSCPMRLAFDSDCAFVFVPYSTVTIVKRRWKNALTSRLGARVRDWREILRKFRGEIKGNEGLLLTKKFRTQLQIRIHMIERFESNDRSEFEVSKRSKFPTLRLQTPKSKFAALCQMDSCLKKKKKKNVQKCNVSRPVVRQFQISDFSRRTFHRNETIPVCLGESGTD